MKVALVAPGEWDGRPLWSNPRFLRPEILLTEGFAELGHEATIFCHAPESFPAEISAVRVDRATLADERFWREGRYDMVVVWTWLHSYGDVVESASRAGSFVAARGDTHGQVGVRAHPGATLRHSFYSAPLLTPRLRSLWLWAKKLAYLHARSDALILANLEKADATVVETDVARDGLVRFLRTKGAPELEAKVHVAPFTPLELRFRSEPVSTSDKARRVLAVGRWDDPAKNTGLLISTLRRYLAVDAQAHAVVAGGGGAHIPAEVGDARCEYVGHVEHDTLIGLMRSSRICLVTSRWESFHAGAHESAANGATVVGTPIPAVRSLAAGGRFGTVARSHRARDLVRALTAEMALWDAGSRDADAIADHWRERLSPAAVAACFAELPTKAAPR